MVTVSLFENSARLPNAACSGTYMTCLNSACGSSTNGMGCQNSYCSGSDNGGCTDKTC